MAEWANILLQGALIGGLYALYAAGLSLMFGVMRFVNTAHGDFIVLAAYLALVTADAGVPPLLVPVVLTPIMAALGFAMQRGLFNRLTDGDPTRMIVLTVGVSIVLQNALLEIFTADSRRLQAGAVEVWSIPLGGGVSVGVFPLAIFLCAVAVIGALELFFYRTRAGAAFRAVSDSPSIAGLMGIDNRRLYAAATAIVFAVVAVAGFLLAIRTNFDPVAGPGRLIYAFEAVIIGGLGNLWGTLAGGVILGVAQAIGAAIDPGLQILAGHLVFLVVLLARPAGLFRARTPE